MPAENVSLSLTSLAEKIPQALLNHSVCLFARCVAISVMLVAGGGLGSCAASVNPGGSGSSLSSASLPKAEMLPVLHEVSQVRRLTLEKAAQSIPVRLYGTVTEVSGYKDSFFFQDGAEGISVERSGTPVLVGDRIQLTGVSGTGMFAPIVLASHVVVLSRSPGPVARKVTYADLIGGAQDSQWIEIEGIVHSAKPSTLYQRATLVLGVEIGGATVRAIVQESEGLEPSKLIGARVQIRGVCITDYNDRRQFIGVGLLVPQRNDLIILEPAAADPFSIVQTQIRDALRFGQGSQRIRVIGVATYSQPGVALYLQDGPDAIRVQTASQQLVEVGERVEAVGFPVAGQYAPVLQDGYFRVLGKGPKIQPLLIKPRNVTFQREEFNDATYDEQLVQMQGQVIESRMEGHERIWLMQDQGKVFNARLSLPASSTSTLDDLGPGSILLLTGIHTVQTDADHNPVGFGLIVQSPEEVKVIRKASWWTSGHLIMLLVPLGAAVLFSALWAVMLKRRVREQTKLLRDSEATLRHQATHDGLTALLNRNAVLNALSACVEDAGKTKTQVAAVLIDLDHFKRINDTHGHLAGDEVLRAAALRLSNAIRKTDTIGRYGGEEFLIIFSRVDQVVGMERCELLRAALSANPVHFGEKYIHVTGSIGIACSYGKDLSAMNLVAQADSAMYRAKTTGRNKVVSFSPEDELRGGVSDAKRTALRPLVMLP